MALKITPGPLVPDGTRITATGDISDFITNTDVKNIGRPEVSAGGKLNFITAATEPPPESQRDRTTIWFKRGDGRLYQWALNPTGATGGRWLAISERRENLFHVAGEGPVGITKLAWLPSPEDPSEPNPVTRLRFGHRVLSLAATDSGSASSRALLIGPFAIAQETADPGEFAVGLELGFGRLTVESSASGTAMLGKRNDELSPLGHNFDNVFDRLATNDHIGLGYVTQSGPRTPEAAVEVFFFGVPTHLTG